MKILTNNVESILNAIKSHTYSVGVIGLGYVGLPLLIAFQKKGFPVCGFDTDANKIHAINTGHSYFNHIPSIDIEELQQSEKCQATTNFSCAKDMDALIMCVPTPLQENMEPDLSYIINTTRSIAPFIKSNTLIILESTTYPGTTEETVKPICEQISKLCAGKDFYLAYSPEREDPGNPIFQTSTIPKIVAGDGQEALNIATTLYQEIIEQVVPVKDTQTGEAVKLVENIFRAVNIALVNELKMVFESMDIDIHSVIDAAKTKPFGYMPFYPGPGLGGHCIPIDPFYLAWKAQTLNMPARFIKLAGEINGQMPQYVVDRVITALEHTQQSINKSRILCIGLAYKPDIDDCRESPTFAIMNLLKQHHAHIEYFDPYIPSIPKTRKHKYWENKQSIEWSSSTLSSADVAIIITNHSVINYKELVKYCPLIVDTRNALVNISPQSPHQIWKA